MDTEDRMKLRPEDGDTCLRCPHLSHPSQLKHGAHVFHFDTDLQHPSGKAVRIHWVFLCDTCFATRSRPTDGPLSSPFTWRFGDLNVRKDGN